MTNNEPRPKRPHLSVTIDAEVWAKLEDYRYENRIPSRAAAVEELLSKGFAMDAKA